MRVLSFAASSVLTLVGMSLSVCGIVQSEYKLFAIGLVLISGAGVFAMLHVGSRWILSRSTK